MIESLATLRKGLMFAHSHQFTRLGRRCIHIHALFLATGKFHSSLGLCQEAKRRNNDADAEICFANFANALSYSSMRVADQM